MTDLLSPFLNIIMEAKKTQKAPKSSSLIKQWLGIDVPQSTSIRIGNYLEKLFNELLGENNILSELTETSANSYTIRWEGETHQVDMLARIDGVIYTRELKTNLDLDRGKKRDIVYREHAIKTALEEKYKQPINSCIFNPLLINSKTVPGLGYVEGFNEFTTIFNLPIDTNAFLDLGRNETIHRALLLQT